MEELHEEWHDEGEARRSSVFASARRTFAQAVARVGELTVFVSLLAFFGSRLWAIDLLSHYRMHYCAILVLAAGLCVVSRQMERRFLRAVVFLGVAAIDFWPLAPYFVGPTPERSVGRRAGIDGTLEAREREVRFLVCNVYQLSRSTELVVERIASVDPDVVVLVEVDQRWIDALGELERAYGHGALQPDGGMRGLAVYSKLPIVERTYELTGDGGMPFLRVVIDVRGVAVAVFAAHPPPPMSMAAAAAQYHYFDALADAIAASPRPTIVAGDLNATPWCAPLERFLAATGLRDSSLGIGYHATWPAVLGAAGIPIDHVLISNDIGVAAKRVVGDVGSDHLPIAVDCWIEPNAEEDDGGSPEPATGDRP